jgi:DNA/RNA endonuclease G (NUC1)
VKNEKTSDTDYKKYQINVDELKKTILKYYPKIHLLF